MLKIKLVLHRQNRQQQRGVTGGQIGLVKPDVELALLIFYKEHFTQYTLYQFHPKKQLDG